MTKTTAMGHMPKPELQPTYTSTTTTYATNRAHWLRVFAGQAMQGMLANPETVKRWRESGKDYLDESIASTAVRCASLLLDAIEDHEKEEQQCKTS